MVSEISAKKSAGRFLSVVFIFFCLGFQCFGQIVTSDVFGYTIDMPEMSYIADYSEDETAVLFLHQLLPVQTAIRIWEQEKFENSKKCLESTLKKTGGTGLFSEVVWRNLSCSICEFTLDKNVMGEKMAGWGICVPLVQKKSYIAALSFAPEKNAFDCLQFILSVLDSISIDNAGLRQPGIVTTFAFPRNNPKKITVSAGGLKIATEIDDCDEEANQFVIDREFAVFKLFASQKCWKEAWQRFYRLIAKDAAVRLRKPAFDIFTKLENSSRKKDPESPDFQTAQELLYSVQNFPYERKDSDPSKADFTSLPAVLCGKGSDCDSRSLLLMTMFTSMGLDSIMLVSVDYSHAMVGLHQEGKLGQSYTLDGKEYLFGETTAKKMTFGKIDSKMQDRSKWIPVELYGLGL